VSLPSPPINDPTLTSGALQLICDQLRDISVLVLTIFFLRARLRRCHRGQARQLSLIWLQRSAKNSSWLQIVAQKWSNLF